MPRSLRVRVHVIVAVRQTVPKRSGSRHRHVYRRSAGCHERISQQTVVPASHSGHERELSVGTHVLFTKISYHVENIARNRLADDVTCVPRGHGGSCDRDHWHLQFVSYVRVAPGAQQLRDEQIVLVGPERCPKIFRPVNGLARFLVCFD